MCANQNWIVTYLLKIGKYLNPECGYSIGNKNSESASLLGGGSGKSANKEQQKNKVPVREETICRPTRPFVEDPQACPALAHRSRRVQSQGREENCGTLARHPQIGYLVAARRPPCGESSTDEALAVDELDRDSDTRRLSGCLIEALAVRRQILQKSIQGENFPFSVPVIVLIDNLSCTAAAYTNGAVVTHEQAADIIEISDSADDQNSLVAAHRKLREGQKGRPIDLTDI
ncbi:hypothetical protein B0H13DRAFT_1854650 [Mycena leptocephala]|nr:hypothetical protein B0H13DRAFT_1854650 [Mycena leptocephala]